MVSRGDNIRIGTRVEGCFGPLIPNPNPAIKHHMRSRVVGTVLRALERHQWEERFDYDGKEQAVQSNGLNIIPIHTGIPLNEESDCISSSSDTVTTVTAAAVTTSSSTTSTSTANGGTVKLLYTDCVLNIRS